MSESNTQAVINHIRDQEKHHRRRSFEQEYVAFLKGTVSTSTHDMFSDDALTRAAPLGLGGVLPMYPPVTGWAQ